MISLQAVLYVFIGVFALIGALRGWAKEMLVAFSVILALFLLNVFTIFSPVRAILEGAPPATRFWFQTLFVVVLAMFGYAGPAFSTAVRGKLKKETIQDIMLGTVIGAINGYLIMGTILYYLHTTNYPFSQQLVTPMDETSAAMLLKLLIPQWLRPPLLYLAVGLSFVIVIVLFV